MHNLHYVRVKANSGEEACQFAESALMDFGNENNWRTFCGAVSQDDEVYNAGIIDFIILTDDGRYIPMNTNASVIEAINDQVNGWIKSCWYGKIAEDKFAKGETNLSEWESHELYSLSKWANHLSQANSYKDKSFNVLEDSFFAYQYDELGVSDCTWEGNGDKIWIVFVDMHS